LAEEKINSRMVLAEQLFAFATNTSEIAMRSSLSRPYYASFHLGSALTGGKGHSDVVKRLTDSQGDVGRDLKKFHDLRSQMDYAPDFFKDLRGRDINIQDWYQTQMQEGISLYYRLRQILEQERLVRS
jgi:uncharacterized protein (UPF0332 family)